MSKGLGKIQRECLRVIESYEAAGKWATTYNIVAEVYQIKRDRHGNRMCSDAQHTAVKRGLAGLGRKGLINGQQALARLPDGQIILARQWRGRAIRCCYWSSAGRPQLSVANDAEIYGGSVLSNRRIAFEIGASVSTVRRARKKVRDKAEAA
jgi:hypothetical protein